MNADSPHFPPAAFASIDERSAIWPWNCRIGEFGHGTAGSIWPGSDEMKKGNILSSGLVVPPHQFEKGPPKWTHGVAADTHDYHPSYFIANTADNNIEYPRLLGSATYGSGWIGYDGLDEEGRLIGEFGHGTAGSIWPGSDEMKKGNILSSGLVVPPHQFEKGPPKWTHGVAADTHDYHPSYFIANKGMQKQHGLVNLNGAASGVGNGVIAKNFWVVF